MNIAHEDYELISNNNNNNNNNNTLEQNELFPPSRQQQEQQSLLWQNVDTISFTEEPSRHSPQNNSFSPSSELHCYDSQRPAIKLENMTSNAEDTSVFNISWGGNDKPPVELHPGEEDEPMKLSRPLPKPRGIRKLPEPEPSEDGTVDEDTLKRRKNTDAARRSRMKKLLKIDQLESRVATLQAENAHLVLNNAVLESEKRTMNAKEAEYKKRIKYLEDIVKKHGLLVNSNQETHPPPTLNLPQPSSNESVGTVERWLVDTTDEMKY